MATTLPSATEPIDLMDPVMFDDPFPVYERLRATRPVAPVKWPQQLRGGGFMLTRYDDVMRMHTDKVFSSDAAEHGTMNVPRFAPKTFRLLTESMVFKDDPEHLRLRSLVNRAFTPKLVASMTDDIEDVVAKYIGRLEGQTTVDLVEDPLAVISRMLGMSGADGDDYCLGNQLARREGRAALGALVQRFDEIELAVPRSELSFKPTPSLRGYRKLPLRLK